jgi:hypothetical protein
VGFSVFFLALRNLLNPVRSALAVDASQNPHHSKTEGWGTRTSRTSALLGPPAKAIVDKTRYISLGSNIAIPTNIGE